MDNERLKREIIYGKVVYFFGGVAVINDSKTGNMISFDDYTLVGDYPGLYEGEEVVALSYTYTWINGCKKTLAGIIDKKLYDNAIRDSQKMPKGWLHEPIFEEKITHGVVLARTEKTITYIPDSENEPKTINDYDCFFHSNFRKINVGDEIVEYEYTHIFPDGTRHNPTKDLYRKDEFLYEYSKNKVI